MYIVMNVVHATEGSAEEFERTFRDRQSHLSTVPGFLAFELLRRDENDEYVVLTRWRDEEAFEEWVASDAFFAAHRHRDHTLTELVEMRSYEVIQSEAGSPAEAGSAS